MKPNYTEIIKRDKPILIKWEISGNTIENKVKLWINGTNKGYSDSKIYYLEDKGSFEIPIQDLQNYKDSQGLEVCLSIGKHKFIELKNKNYIILEVFSQYQTNYQFAK